MQILEPCCELANLRYFGSKTVGLQYKAPFHSVKGYDNEFQQYKLDFIIIKIHIKNYIYKRGTVSLIKMKLARELFPLKVITM